MEGSMTTIFEQLVQGSLMAVMFHTTLKRPVALEEWDGLFV